MLQYYYKEETVLRVLFEHFILALVVGCGKSHFTLSLVVHHLLHSSTSVVIQVRQLQQGLQ